MNNEEQKSMCNVFAAVDGVATTLTKNKHTNKQAKHKKATKENENSVGIPELAKSQTAESNFQLTQQTQN